ncbi:MAG: hypothetical protein HY699_15170 [Deltaproteobacteria bacterium]|nr:hypothetical protein [Deltaproteobacteria bacterium]
MNLSFAGNGDNFDRSQVRHSAEADPRVLGWLKKSSRGFGEPARNVS